MAWFSVFERIALASLIACSVTLHLNAQETPTGVRDYTHESAADQAARMAWFNKARFGLFIHWGLYAEPAGRWNGQDVPGTGEWIQKNAEIPVAEYTALQARFNPVKYDPDAWVRLAKQAGMKYLVITSKHHDGFCLFDSEYTNWDMEGTPYKKDLLRPLAEACHRHGIKLCFYHSIMDWHHPQYGNKEPWRGNHDTPSPDMDAYRDYMKGQLKELITNYGELGVLWFDGEWESCWTHEMGVDLYNYCRHLQPSILVNNRVDKGRDGMAGLTKAGDFVGDFGTPEQEIPATGLGAGVSWESCMTMNDTWGFKASDHHWKSTETLIRNLVDIASKGGNFLLNVGPTATGEFPPASVQRLEEMGQWMNVFGDSIYETHASPFEQISWSGRCTQKSLPSGNTRLYLHVFDWPTDGQLHVATLVNKPLAAQVMGSPDQLVVSGQPGHWTIQLPNECPNRINSVIQVDVKDAVSIETGR